MNLKYRDYDLVSAFRRDIGTFTQMEREDLPDLIGRARTKCKKHKKTPDETCAQCRLSIEAKQEIVTHCLGLSFHMLKKFWTQMEREDIISISNEAIVDAVNGLLKSYDPTKGSGHPINYVKFVVEKALCRALDEQRSVVRIPETTKHQKRAIKKGQEFSPSTMERVGRLHGTDKSLNDEPKGSNSDDPDPTTLIDIIPDEKSPIPEIQFATKETRDYLKKWFKATLSEKTWPVVECVFFEGMTAAETQKTLGITPIKFKGRMDMAYTQLRQMPGLKDELLLAVAPYRPFGRAKVGHIPATESGALRTAAAKKNNKARKFTDEQVSEIRKLKAEGMAQQEIAKQMGCSAGLVSMIVNNQVRKHGK